MNTSNGLILWTLGAAGTLLIYSGYKNVKPQSVIRHYFSPAGSSYGTSDAIQPGKPIAAALPKIPRSKNPNAGGGAGGSVNPLNPLGIDPLAPFGIDYNTSGNNPQNVPAAYRNSPGTYIPAKAMTA